MKVRGTLKITKNLIVPGPNGTTGAQGLVAISDSNGSLYWGRFYVLDVDESLTYIKGTLVMVGEKVYIAKVNDASGVIPLDPAQWLELGEAGGGGSELTQAQLDAINGANNPSGSNPFATVADIHNLTLVGTDTIENILLKDPLPPNKMWISSTVGFDSGGVAVLIGDGIVSNGAEWHNIGPMRGPQGEIGPPGAGTAIVGSDTVANILLKDAVAGENTLWVALDDGIDDAANAVVAGDGLVSDGAQWLGVGPIRGPQGDKGDKGDPGASEYYGTYLIKGGIEWLYGYTYRVTADKYVIVGILYSAPPIIITLGSSDPVIDRTDTFVANYAGIISVKTGSTEVNEAIEVRISQVVVKANTTVDPIITGSIIYDEQSGGEWTASVISAGSASIDLAFVGDFVSGAQSTRVLNGRTVVIEYVAPAPVPVASSFSVLTFRMKSLLTTSNAVVTMSLYNGTAKASSSLDVTEFGYDFTNDTDWQYITMYVNHLNITTTDVSKLRLSIDDPTLSEKSEFLIDIIKYQHGVYMPPSAGTIPEYTSQLINNGETGSSPYATIDDLPAAPTLQSVTDIGNTTTNEIVIGSITKNRLSSTRSQINSVLNLSGAAATQISLISSSSLQFQQLKTSSGDSITGSLSKDRIIFSNNLDSESSTLKDSSLTFSAATAGNTVAVVIDPIVGAGGAFIQTLQYKSGIIALKSDIDAITGTYVHTEGSALSTWTINHFLGKYPSVMVVDTGRSTIDAVVTYVDTDTITITLSPASAGYAYLN